MLPPARPHGQPLTCAVCDATISWPQSAAPGAAVCSAAPCRQVMGQQATLSPQAFKFHLQYHVATQRSRKAALAEKAQREAEENARHWAALQAHAGSAAPGTVVPLVLPSGPRRETRLTHRRRRAYRAHLYRMLREALAANIEATPAPTSAALPSSTAIDPLAPLRERLCAACAGGCCTAGGDVAYLTAATMQRVMAQQPTLSPRKLVAAYVGRLAEQTLVGSCINHTRNGCSLPRELRSDTCNRYLCEAQKEIGALAGEGSAPGSGPQMPRVVALVIVRRQGQWTKGAPGLPNDVIGTACISATETRALLALPAV